MIGKKLNAGKLTLWYEEGFLRYIQCGTQEVIRMINHALRDHNWGTIPMKIKEENIQEEKDAFLINYKASFSQGDISFDLSCEIIGRPDDSINFTYKGKALSDFRRNRIGFTVLHPVTPCAGNPITIVHTDQSRTQSHFPVSISPHQPFMEIKEMHWSLEEHIEASLFFEGEVFEAEDQRNWTDASYKTYCTPLGIPFPVQLRKGDEVEQGILLKVKVPNAISVQEEGGKVYEVKVQDESPTSMPAIGAMLTQHMEPEILRELIKDLGLAYLRVNVELDEAKDQSPLSITKNIGIPLELAVFSDSPDVQKLQDWTKGAGEIKRILIFGNTVKVTPITWLNKTHELRNAFPNVQLFGGTDAFFTELNRDRVNAVHLDGVSYSINPQVHAFDDQSLIETLPAQGYTVNSAQTLYPNKPVVISPVSLHMRWNPNATDPDKPLREPTQWTDERQYTPFGAFWWLISLKYLHLAGAEEVCYFELMGDDGWVRQVGEGLEKSPIYSLRSKLKPFDRAYPCTCDQPLIMDAVGFENGNEASLFLVNWAKEEIKVRVPEGFRPVEYLSEDKFEWQPTDLSIASLPKRSLVHFKNPKI
jgi:D-apionolactonase